MNVFLDALKKSRAFGFLKSDCENGLSHAYMIISPDGDALDAFFTLAAALVYCERGDACMICAACRTVLDGAHADVYHIYPDDKGKIKADDISKGLIPTVDIRALSGRKLYFIHRADLMLPAAQNKLLKTLEEPPEGVTLFLGVENESSMLETVRSRSRKIYIDEFEEKDIYDILVSCGKDPRLAAVAAACSEGTIGKALKIAESEEYVRLYDDAASIYEMLDRSSDVLETEGIFLAQQDLGKLLDVLSIVTRDMIAAKGDKDLMLSKHVSDRLTKISEKYSERALAIILSKINEARKKLSLNVNAVAVTDSLLFSMLEVRHKCR